MKNFAPFYLKNLYMVLFCFILVSCKKDTKPETDATTSEASDLAYKSETASCNCESNWFPHSQTPAPEEGKGSPFDTSSTTNCIFHQWSWQKFLWLTKPQQNNNPLFLNELTQVSDALIPVQKQNGAEIVLTYTQQAGSNGVLKANPAYSDANQIAKDFTVYYSIHSNDILLKAAKNFKDSINSKKLPENNLKTFPVGSLELKVSWVDANTIRADKQKDFFITTAAITADGKTFTQKKVALLGMHVVGVVINHPEFIWATFQHNDLAPVFDWKNHHATATDEKLLYSKGTTTDLGGITWQNTSPVTPLKAYDLFQFGVPKNSSDEFMKTAQQEPMNFDNIKNINDCVASQLDDVWKNYFYNGSIWINTDGMTPTQQAEKIVQLAANLGNATPGSFARGSLNNANISMETYTQTFESSIDTIAVDNLANCFSCHSSVAYNKKMPNTFSPLHVSHSFKAYVKSSQGESRIQIERLKDVEFEATKKALR